MYRCEATSVAGFIQQLAVGYISRGYFYYVCGRIPERKDPHKIDARIIEKYGIGKSKWSRAKRAGRASVQYIRYKDFFVICATEGFHRFKLEDIRREPIRFDGHSVGYHRGRDRKFHVSVRMHPEVYRKVKAYFLDIAVHRKVETVVAEVNRLTFLCFAPVRNQIAAIVRAVNRARKKAGFELVRFKKVGFRRRQVCPFGNEEGMVKTRRSLGEGARRDARAERGP